MDRQDVPAAFDSAAATHVGKVRDRNEDYYLVQPQTGIWAVADGMGGGEIGDIASSSVIAELRTIAPPKSASDLLASCEERIMTANIRLIALAENHGADTIIATTVAVLLIFENYYACIRSGGSRIYCIRDGNITQLSRDHTEVQALVAKGVLKGS